jgi:hypothetical protein
VYNTVRIPELFEERTSTSISLYTALAFDLTIRLGSAVMIGNLAILSLVGLIVAVNAQLTGRVGPTTTREAKRAVKICNVRNYKGVASKTADIGPAIVSAFAACKDGGTRMSTLAPVPSQRCADDAVGSLYPAWRVWHVDLG